MTGTTRNVATILALGILCLVLAAAVALWYSSRNASTLSGLFTGLGVGLFMVAARHHFRGRRLEQ